MALDPQRNWDVVMADALHRVRTLEQEQAGREASQRRAKHQPPSENQTKEFVAPYFRPDAPAYHLPPELLDMILRHADASMPNHRAQQIQLYNFSLVSHGFYDAATPMLYGEPWLIGNAYHLFLRTICPSVNYFVRRSPLAHLIRRLNLSMLVHQGTKSTTARLLGRAKENIEVFIAPQASFSLTCFPALSKCQKLEALDLTLVSDAPDMLALFDAIVQLPRLKALYLPRSAAHSTRRFDPAQLKWPSSLRKVYLSGGLDPRFYSSHLDLPPALNELGLLSVPNLDDAQLNRFLDNISMRCAPDSMTLTGKPRMALRTFFVQLCPRLSNKSMDNVLHYLPELTKLSVSIDYFSTDLLNFPPPIMLTDDNLDDYARSLAWTWSDDEEESDDFDSSDETVDAALRHERTLRRRERARRKLTASNARKQHRPGRRPAMPDADTLARDPHVLLPHQHGLEVLEITDSGSDLDPESKITPIDVLLAADDAEALPRLRILRVESSLGWHVGESGLELDAVDDWLLDNARGLLAKGLVEGTQKAGVQRFGVKRS